VNKPKTGMVVGIQKWGLAINMNTACLPAVDVSSAGLNDAYRSEPTCQ
jgi:hypothetical protein